ncbi:MAG: hypothetical protein IH577_01790 [Deltaproteobacteria bacterium]|nr:hypothetical protein [Deltaproteobacteria bacterium]
MAEKKMVLEVSGNSVAWYGAIVATISVILSAYNAFRDRARIKITYIKDMIIIGKQDLYNKAKTYFNVTVINKGRRPIRIDRAGLRIIGRKRIYALFSDSFMPHRNKVITEESPKTDFMIEQDDDLLNSTWYIVVYDGVGKEYRKYLRFIPVNLFINSFRKKQNDAV